MLKFVRARKTLSFGWLTLLGGSCEGWRFRREAVLFLVGFLGRLIQLLLLFDLHVEVDHWGVSLIGVILLEFSFADVTIATQRHVHVLTSDHCLAIFARRAERETRVMFAKLANGLQLLNLFAFGDQVQDRGERASQKGTLKRGNYHDFAFVCGFFWKFYQIGKELALINANNVKLFPNVAKFHKFGASDRFGFLLIVRRDDKLVRPISQVGLELDFEDSFARDFMLATPSQQFGRFARKHAPKNEFDATAHLLLRNRDWVLSDCFGRSSRKVCGLGVSCGSLRLSYGGEVRLRVSLNDGGRAVGRGGC